MRIGAPASSTDASRKANEGGLPASGPRPSFAGSGSQGTANSTGRGSPGLDRSCSQRVAATPPGGPGRTSRTRIRAPAGRTIRKGADRVPRRNRRFSSGSRAGRERSSSRGSAGAAAGAAGARWRPRPASGPGSRVAGHPEPVRTTTAARRTRRPFALPREERGIDARRSVSSPISRRAPGSVSSVTPRCGPLRRIRRAPSAAGYRRKPAPCGRLRGRTSR